MQYRITREECQKKCDGMVCTTCGSPITPFETVDNSRNPTHWPGCEKCHKFNYGVPQEVYKKAAAIKNDFYNVSIEDMCSIAWTLLPDAQAIEEERDRLEAENRRLEAWIDDLQSEMYINCVYCGHRYGPNKGDHLVTMRKTLEKHIEECPKHPLSMARNRIMELEAENKRLREALDGITTVAKIICNEIPVGTASLYGWVLIGEEALKEDSHE